MRELMYIENKDGDIDGTPARIGWVTFSKTKRTAYYRGKTLRRANVIRGNHVDVDTGEEYWVSGVKRRGSNVHPAERVAVEVDGDAMEEYRRLKGGA